VIDQFYFITVEIFRRESRVKSCKVLFVLVRTLGVSGIIRRLLTDEYLRQEQMNIDHVESFLFSQSADVEGSRSAGDRSRNRFEPLAVTSFCQESG